MAYGFKSSHHHLLDFHIVAVDKAEHVNTWCGLKTLAVAAIDLLVTEDTPVEVHDLQDGLAIIVNDPVAVAEKGEWLTVTLYILAGGSKH